MWSAGLQLDHVGIKNSLCRLLNDDSLHVKLINAAQSLWYRGVEQGSYANRNACQYLREGSTLNCLFFSSQTKI